MLRDGKRRTFPSSRLSEKDRRWLQPYAETPRMRLLGYLPNYRMSDAVLTTFGNYTDIVYFGAEIAADGSVTMSEKHRAGLIKISETPEPVKIHFCLGGWGKDKHFASVTADPQKRKRLVDDLIRLQREYDFHGVDYDWEYPRSPAELENFGSLIRETQERFYPAFEVSAAFSPVHNVPKVIWEHLDRVHLMTYDLGPEHCAVYHSVNAIKRFKKLGIPDEKLTIGAAFYARHQNNHGNVKTYADLVRTFGKDVASDNRVGGYFYDNPKSLEQKIKLVKKSRIAGVIIWEIGQDTDQAELSLGTFLKKYAK